ncbi:DNA polymerase kappa [Patellaria atrata CBS 101060]|uniref:DNA polymerase kappa n=1 Tax=Patellaria atrata CBS 101060 TaxID=1346257 RepID=A0A9P4S357_9PEZI|nr:DNA polymerase kappa [Patellaria atrata CBS 101060]
MPSETESHPESSEDPAASQHHTLKYQLLGPSLTKSGQDNVDQQKVSDIIYNASKGSKFFNNEEARDRVLTEKVSRILAKKRELERLDLSHHCRRADEYIAELELSRDLSQVVVHIDCDAFYAAVEELDRPELKNVPFAVGKGVLTTCNYHARKFGCRSGMASFVALKLCPQLVCLPLNFDKYSAKAEEVRDILADYDPRFESASIDEAYLNITEYCKIHGMTPEDAVQQLRREVYEKTKITVSAGIAANAKLAKIASNKNKPNGQFVIPSDRLTIMEFMRNLPTRKVNGVGRVFERELDAVGIKTCGDIYTHRATLSKLFGIKAFQFLISCYLGLGRTKIQPAQEYERKSVGTESTFRDMSDPAELRSKLRRTAEELEGDLERTQFKGRTLVLKIKLHTYEVLTRQVAPPKAVQIANDLYKYALPMLTKLEKEIPNMKLRLMGLRVTHLVSTKKGGIDFFGANRRIVCSNLTPSQNKPSSDDEWEVWPEQEFEAAERQEKIDDMNETESLSQENCDQPDDVIDQHISESNEVESGRQRYWPRLASPSSGSNERESGGDFFECPVCSRPQPADDATFNAHIDFCLSKQTIRDVARGADTGKDLPSVSDTPKSKWAGLSTSRKPLVQAKKRARPRENYNNNNMDGEEGVKKRFFA